MTADLSFWAKCVSTKRPNGLQGASRSKKIQRIEGALAILEYFANAQYDKTSRYGNVKNFWIYFTIAQYGKFMQYDGLKKLNLGFKSAQSPKNFLF